jgi:NitT/TauT family transport system ATP-binding protein
VQDYGASLFPWLRVSTNVALAMGNLDLSLAAKREKTEELLRKVGLEGSGQRYPWQLSGGMQQRVAIARALAPLQ